VIKDDGKGFDVTPANSGNGLKNMQQRAAALHGELSIISSIQNGTIIKLSFKV
jgi:signal transduction histidine kinase